MFYKQNTLYFLSKLICKPLMSEILVFLQDNGSPPLASQTYLVIDIRDGDDLNPSFTQELYTTQISEDYPITVGISPILWVSRLI